MARPRKKPHIATSLVAAWRADKLSWKVIESRTGVSEWTWRRRLAEEKKRAKPVLHGSAGCTLAPIKFFI